MPDEPSRPRLLDARSLRGLAHPLRMQLLVALRRGGPATASQLAQKLGESSGSTSYHLRQLATHGFIEDAPEQGKGRERWWKAMDEGLEIDDTLLRDPDPAVRGAAAVFGYELANIHTQEVATWLGNRHEWPEEWDNATDLSDFTGRLTPEMARELIQKMHELIESYRPLPEDTPGAQTVRIHTHLFPSTRE
ncbi:ArsR/SmtB family transcription factor [Streptomyces sp. NPDC057257]|uniref:ArsR/SmtB family transcription factor n=1 Tax=Streptomyces sp. NPDC057257 TaxID=3346071 RepID=UPI003629AEFE